MRGIILLFTYILCAFVPVLMFLRLRKGISPGVFWTSWSVSLVGSFTGGMFGTMLIARAGYDFGLTGNIVTGLAGAWILTVLFFKLRELPGTW